MKGKEIVLFSKWINLLTHKTITPNFSYISIVFTLSKSHDDRVVVRLFALATSWLCSFNINILFWSPVIGPINNSNTCPGLIGPLCIPFLWVSNG